MIRHGTPPFLECSSKGDRRFSAFHARIRGRGSRSIEEIYQGSKILSDGRTGLSWREAKGKKPVNAAETEKLYSQLWQEYILENPDLIPELTRASGTSDMFGQPGHVCQATELWNIRNQELRKQNEKSTTAVSGTAGSIRIGNKRAGAREKPKADEIVIDADRNNPVLGNRHILKNHLDDTERHQVIEAYRKDYEADWNRAGPMRKATEELADMVREGKKVILMCWCSGAPLNKPCHADIIKDRVAELVENRTERRIDNARDPAPETIPAQPRKPDERPEHEDRIRTALQNIFPARAPHDASYAGIGSKLTPAPVMDAMKRIAAELERRGFHLNSGGADGADSAFQAGVVDSRSASIFVPWSGFKNSDGVVPNATLITDPRITAEARRIAAEHHPVFERLSNGSQALHTRNVYQVLGPDLAHPVRAVIAWTKDGQASGGTGQAIRLAQTFRIPVINLQIERNLRLLLEHLNLPSSSLSRDDHFTSQATPLVRNEPDIMSQPHRSTGQGGTAAHHLAVDHHPVNAFDRQAENPVVAIGLPVKKNPARLSRYEDFSIG